MTVARLGLEVDSGQAKAAAVDLDKLTVSADKATKGVARMRDESGRFVSATGNAKTATEQFQREVDNAVAATNSFTGSTQRAGGAAQAFAAANDNAARSAGMMRGALSNLALQGQDVAVQIGAGTSALVVLAQQGPQIASGFGPVGAVIGLAIAAVAGLALVTKGLWGETDKLKASQEAAEKTAKALDTTLGNSIDNAEELMRYYKGLTGAVREFERVSIGAGQRRIVEEQIAIKRQVESVLEGAEQQRAVILDLQSISRMGAGPPTKDQNTLLEGINALAKFRKDGDVPGLVIQLDALAKRGGDVALNFQKLSESFIQPGRRAIQLAEDAKRAEAQLAILAGNPSTQQIDDWEGHKGRERRRQQAEAAAKAAAAAAKSAAAAAARDDRKELREIERQQNALERAGASLGGLGVRSGTPMDQAAAPYLKIQKEINDAVASGVLPAKDLATAQALLAQSYAMSDEAVRKAQAEVDKNGSAIVQRIADIREEAEAMTRGKDAYEQFKEVREANNEVMKFEADLTKAVADGYGNGTINIAAMVEEYKKWRDVALQNGEAMQRQSEIDKEVARAANDNIREQKQILGGFFSDMQYGLKNGATAWEAFADAGTRALDRVIDKINDELLDALFKVKDAASGGKSGGGIFDTLLGIGNAAMSFLGFGAPAHTTGVGGAGFSYPYYGGPRANGGPVRPGNWYMVGERGPEPFVPDVPGRIVPNHRLAGAANSNAPQQVELVVTLSGDFDARMTSVAENVSVRMIRKESPKIVSASVKATRDSAAEFPIR